MRKWIFFCLGTGLAWSLVRLYRRQANPQAQGGGDGERWRLRDEAELRYPEEMFVGALQETAPGTETADLLDQVSGTSGLAGR